MDYIQYCFSKLFSGQFFNIMGSSLILSFGMVLITVLSMIGTGYSLHKFTMDHSFLNDSWLFLVLFGLVIFLIIMTLSLLVHGWLAIIIPIRSIDPTEKMDFWEDYLLFKTYIGIYFWYAFWYTLALLGIFLSYPILLILLSAVHWSLWWIFGIGWILAILYMMTRLYLCWYHMLSEGSGSFRVFRESIKLSRGKVWKIFWKVFAFSVIIGVITSTIESTMGGLFSTIGSSTMIDGIALIARENKDNLAQMLPQLGSFLIENSWNLWLTTVIFGMFFSLSTVISRALYHIFYVRFYLDIREEHENENSFVKSILYWPSHSQNP